MRAGLVALVCTFLAFGSVPLSAQEPAAPVASNLEMTAIFTADQAARTNAGATVDWSVVGPQDEARRAQTKRLLDAGALRTAEDFFHAAIIFQHGTTADDYLLAHTLAVIATARGHAVGPWTAAASLDRYLQEIGQPQIYGTQYHTPQPTLDTTQEPYNRTLVSDALRTVLGVATQAEQEERRQEMQARYRAARRPE